MNRLEYGQTAADMCGLLESTNQTPPGDTMDPLLLTVAETCTALRLGRTKVYELLTSGDLTSISIGRSRRIPRAAVEDYLSRCLAP